MSTEIRKAICLAYPDHAAWGRTNVTQHAALQCMWLQFDHVVPNSRGGASDIDNVVVTCAPCNFGRMESMLDEARLIDPRTEFRRDTWSGYSTWDGLTRFDDSEAVER